ncbi:MAG: alanine racemase [Candidatus Yanofskybacteria bacterium RIFCSPHIGHO2_01_FULL_43_42]|uniref:Alanine racemase n=1 Tax=Candidatus Yanofskybacteria bacterium RIFCSPLOWO2_01_FULL_43_22 TaxID=1802695 RepID=A0A1F8GDG7_9BACT|nr:MAG: alanine racemase [Candidatus Yanofskybacteria bacterium RIFCSPHIGHO2_01_FULL_43_42]OGN13518.1 MAG: alanine racemase [Candidatus Yanofskybacteria bacterium RIFCSPHIGHO2_02_FULL_43_17]OGN23373.1 MAG: alanine racemase [Candidatus Yanofskybacteria bacterium RIFCSPLOWO2_01_FULL_43_22]
MEVRISKNNLAGNLKEYQRQYPKFSFAPVLKSNAYGHGLTLVAQILDKENIAFFVVDSLYEAMILRNEGVKSEILVIGYVSAENIKSTKISNTAFTITSIEQLQELARTITMRVKIHLKVDTGMHRQGVLPNQTEEAIKIIKANKHIELEGVCSHLADADGSDKGFTESQIQRWEQAADLIKSNFSIIKYFHLANTAGTFYSDRGCCNVVRLGIGLYGVNSSPFSKLHLRPVLQMQTIISSIKAIPAGEFVGYNITYQAEGPIKVATVPVGYFEGVDRRLSNCGFFKIGNNYCPIVGRVSMNTTSVDITSLPDPRLGDPVIIISNNADDKNSVENTAKIAHTISWEILVHIPQHLRRIVVEN